MRSSYTYLNVYRREDLDGAVSFSLARSVQALLVKHYLVLKWHYFDLLTLVTSFLTWPKNELGKNYSLRLPVSNLFTDCLYVACFVFEISGGRLSAPPHVGTKLAQTPIGVRDKYQTSQKTLAFSDILE